MESITPEIRWGLQKKQVRQKYLYTSLPWEVRKVLR